MRVEEDKEKNCKVVVIEFRWAEYRLEINDRAKGEQLLAVLQQALGPKPKKVKETVDLPDFYTGGGRR